MKKKRAALLTAVSLLTMLLAGCGGDPSGDAPAVYMTTDISPEAIGLGSRSYQLVMLGAASPTSPPARAGCIVPPSRIYARKR